MSLRKLKRTANFTKPTLRNGQKRRQENLLNTQRNITKKKNSCCPKVLGSGTKETSSNSSPYVNCMVERTWSCSMTWFYLENLLRKSRNILKLSGQITHKLRITKNISKESKKEKRKSRRGKALIRLSKISLCSYRSGFCRQIRVRVCLILHLKM